MQQALLKILEGSVASVPPQGGRKHPHQEFIQIDTSNILFILGGAFEDLDHIIQRRLATGTTMGFGAVGNKRQSEDDLDQIFTQVTPDDLLKYGFIPEFIGRVPLCVGLSDLSESQLMDVLTEPRNALVKQYQALFQMDDVELEFKRSALLAMATDAKKRHAGARGLRAILEETLLDIMYELPSMDTVARCIIDEPTVTEGEPPVLLDSEGSRVEFKITERPAA